jgi:hypothetical protein
LRWVEERFISTAPKVPQNGVEVLLLELAILSPLQLFSSLAFVLPWRLPEVYKPASARFRLHNGRLDLRAVGVATAAPLLLAGNWAAGISLRSTHVSDNKTPRS